MSTNKKQASENFLRQDKLPAEWLISSNPIPYPFALDFMKKRAQDIARGEANELIWLLEHPPLYTAGTSAKETDLLQPKKLPIFEAGRGGQYTYHGPGQRVVYVMLDLTKRQRDIRALVKFLQAWIIATLANHNIKGEIREDRIGVWVKRPERGKNCEDKIAAIGVRVSRWVSFHGISINIAPDLSHYNGIVPCGISDYGVTSFEDLGHIISLEEVDISLKEAFEKKFGATKNITMQL